MTSPRSQNTALHTEADRILHADGLLDLAQAYGEVFVGGSYHSELMVWRDLDLYIGMDTNKLEVFFDLGRRIVESFHATKAFFTDARNSDPAGLYWGVRLGDDLAHGAWKFDMWPANPEALARRRRSAGAFVERLTPAARSAILELKAHYWADPRYRNEITSDDIYRAVLDEGVRSPSAFEALLTGRDASTRP